MHLGFVWILTLGMAACVQHTPNGRSPRPELASPTQFFERGRALAGQGDTVRAEQYMTMAVRAGFSRERAIIPLIQTCIAGSRLRAALGHAAPYLKRHPENWPLRYIVATISLALGDDLTARDELRRIVAARPQAAQAHYLLAVLQRDKFHDVAAAHLGFESYLRHDPTGPFAPEARAFLEERRGRSSERSSASIIGRKPRGLARHEP